MVVAEGARARTDVEGTALCVAARKASEIGGLGAVRTNFTSRLLRLEATSESVE